MRPLQAAAAELERENELRSAAERAAEELQAAVSAAASAALQASEVRPKNLCPCAGLQHSHASSAELSDRSCTEMRLQRAQQ